MVKSSLSPQKYGCIVIGVSLGGIKALPIIFSQLSADYHLPIVVVQHIHYQENGFLFEYFNELLDPRVKEADEKEQLLAGHIYFAPPNYHLLIERDGSFSLSIDPMVSYSRPSVDVLFESAARAYGPSLVGIILTGANHDGAQGMKIIHDMGGLTIVQDPEEAESSCMPISAIAATKIDHILKLKKIGLLLKSLPKPLEIDSKG